MQSAGDRGLTQFEMKTLQYKQKIRDFLLTEVKVNDRQFESVFVCENDMQAARALSLWIKEAGTMEWLDQNLRHGDRFLDIGANIGIYSIAAAHRIGPTGKVYSAEPHKFNVCSLLNNILRNGFEDRIRVLTVPLTSEKCATEFNYSSIIPASTGSQLGSTMRDGRQGNYFIPVLTELSIALSLDEVIELKLIDHPDLIKIDVDGIELKILQGMKHLLTSSHRPRSIQVELNIGEQEDVIDFLLCSC
ncbi:MAG: FkbM family methyltransferase [Methylocystis sp.]|uniref:FkbM family methyltransferase n=1 Tax=Methylocystis sp. TaxID=1911079 RepID=UPI003DA597E4